jgi:zinc transporter ZupT
MGALSPFASEALEEAIERISARSDFAVAAHDVVLRGTCASCEQARAQGRVGVLGALGLSLHTFTEGVGIGLAFSVNAETGILVLIAVVSHGFADGLNTVSFVISQSGDRTRAKRWLRIDAFAPLAGAAVGSLISVTDQTLGYFLALYAGFFLYMGATDLLPAAHAHEHDGQGSWGRWR